MLHLRSARPGDENALARICLRTADHGADATGLFADDDIWAAVFVLPYAERHPELAFVVADDADDPVGYIVATSDTDAFEEWFRTDWWPRFAGRWPRPASDDDSRQARTLRYAYSRAAGVEALAASHPAHLHIDLLPAAQGQGWGRRLVERLSAELRSAGVAGLHLVASADNTGAVAFYDRLGLERLVSAPGTQAFGRRLTV
ncbi:GNAT family N-acetyltransferase [Microbacterium oleivorans]|uniref:GNAT family N-acetyltransferase n=1 Tax=Microbacterium oleivorans TaxID=273677 RepID=A0A7D5EWR0_9MICO|nr:GNAT family N-acetyltransferase [Microbacterium oleivorans]QLD11150.1 GNAT family N-acetyltransferase [Microbacterium oleivorans]